MSKLYIYFLRVDLIEKGDKNEKGRIASPDCLSSNLYPFQHLLKFMNSQHESLRKELLLEQAVGVSQIIQSIKKMDG